ncbi:urea ABC transporter permease subunit UrtB [Telmatospirillum sp.]|uniref:urea ABC transporter permease subunit UrtB n=1 Tax=Telmatospirillum sp. TaxID=2079197 RepID=UPI00284FD0A2|nr:urea ABC transporter permease subunit UrtB [Telmatospirillum sp.]MDR3439804.1 urea ABC transporter permease subunit UrtB [Telmatospirillum sp.]
MKALRLVLVLASILCIRPADAWAADAPSGDFESAVKALNGDSYDDKIAAIEALGALADGRAAPVLQAMLDGHLAALPDQSLVISENGAYRDALTGAILNDVKADDLSDITINNRVRGVLDGVLGQLSLKSPDPDARRKAAQAMADRRTPGAAEVLRAMLAGETDASVRSTVEAALGTLDLLSPDRSRRLAAIAILAGSSDPNVKGQLERLQDGEKDPELRKAADKAIASITFRLTLINVGANLFQGLSLGSVLLLAAIGLAITFGVMGVINMAHGEMIMLGAYTAYVVQEAFVAWLPPTVIGLYLVVAVPIAFLATGLVGIALERGLIRFLYGRPLETLLSTWGISLILQQVVRSIFGAPNKEVANPAWMTGGVDMTGGFTLTWNRLVIILFCLAVLGILAAVLRYSRFGLQMRAVAQNRPMAAAMGIRTGRVDALTFGLGSGIAGIAGVALSQIGNVSPNLGQGYIVDSFMVVVFGGVGSLWGTLLGATSLGVVNKLLEPYAGAMLGKILVLVFIILFIQKRPRGLFALKGRSIEG